MRSSARLSVGLLVAVVFTPAIAAEAPPTALVEARNAFASAVAAKNIKAAEALTSFPLKNAVFKAPKTISQAGFARQFEMYEQMTHCLKTAPLEFVRGGGGRPNSWTINCDGNILYFAAKQGHWLHDEYENINE